MNFEEYFSTLRSSPSKEYDTIIYFEWNCLRHALRLFYNDEIYGDLSCRNIYEYLIRKGCKDITYTIVERNPKIPESCEAHRHMSLKKYKPVVVFYDYDDKHPEIYYSDASLADGEDIDMNWYINYEDDDVLNILLDACDEDDVFIELNLSSHVPDKTTDQRPVMTVHYENDSHEQHRPR